MVRTLSDGPVLALSMMLLKTVNSKGFAKKRIRDLFGLQNYLVAHAIFVAATLRLRKQEGAVLRFIRALPADATVLDIGLNVGTMALLFAWKAHRGRVIGFEPIPENYEAALRLFRLLRIKNVTVHPFGLGERDDDVLMVMPQDDDGVLLEGTSHVVDADRPAERGAVYTVALRRLEDVARDMRIDAIKIDVEGHERFVLRGGYETIRRCRPIIYAELATESNRKDCVEMLEALGYRAESEPGNVNVLFFPS